MFLSTVNKRMSREEEASSFWLIFSTHSLIYSTVGLQKLLLVKVSYLFIH